MRSQISERRNILSAMRSRPFKSRYTRNSARRVEVDSSLQCFRRKEFPGVVADAPKNAPEIRCRFHQALVREGCVERWRRYVVLLHFPRQKDGDVELPERDEFDLRGWRL